MRRALAGSLVLLLVPPGGAWAKNRALPRYGAFTYSNLCWGRQSGDASGTRFTLTRTREGDRLLLEYGNGPLQSARIKSLMVTGDRLEAQASTADGEATFSAILKRKSAVVAAAFDGRNQPAGGPVFRRIRRFSQKIPSCR